MREGLTLGKGFQGTWVFEAGMGNMEYITLQDRLRSRAWSRVRGGKWREVISRKERRTNEAEFLHVPNQKKSTENNRPKHESGPTRLEGANGQTEGMPDEQRPEYLR